MLKPYIVSKIVDSNTKEVILENKREVVSKVASASTIEQIKDLLHSVICNDSSLKITENSIENENIALSVKNGKILVKNKIISLQRKK